MKDNIIWSFVIGLLSVLLIVVGVVFFRDQSSLRNGVQPTEIENSGQSYSVEKEVTGFLPFWLVSAADKDYSDYINNLAYFGLIVGEDGGIQKFTNPGELEPGYHTLVSGKVDELLSGAREKGMKLTLVVFSGDDETIERMLEDPEKSAFNLVTDTQEIMSEYGFSELNLDIEFVGDATQSQREKYTQFVRAVRTVADKEIIKTLSIDVMASSFVKTTNLVNPIEIAPLVDKMIIMAYDYHYIGSYVTGPVAPGEGAGVVSEFDVQTAVETALNNVPAGKIVLGVPSYGYEWESVGDDPRSAIIPTTGQTISNKRAEELLVDCTSCEVVFDEVDKENHIIYLDDTTGTYHQVFYPDEIAMDYKVKLAKEYGLGGMAVWALGYEGKSILEPLALFFD